MVASDDAKYTPFTAMRVVKVTYSPAITGTKIVRFQGDTFGDLQERMIAAKVPGVHSKSYIELLIPGEGFVCPLPDETLPTSTDITVSVHAEFANNGAQAVANSAAYSELVTGQPVPAEEGRPVRGPAQAPRLSDSDKHFARKEAKMEQKLAKISAKLIALRTKHGTFSDREPEESSHRQHPSHASHHGGHRFHGGHHPHPHPHHHHWGHGCHGPHFGGPNRHSHHPPPAHPSGQLVEGRPVPPMPGTMGHLSHGEGLAQAARGDPSGANSEAEFVKIGKV